MDQFAIRLAFALARAIEVAKEERRPLEQLEFDLSQVELTIDQYVGGLLELAKTKGVVDRQLRDGLSLTINYHPEKSYWIAFSGTPHFEYDHPDLMRELNRLLEF